MSFSLSSSWIQLESGLSGYVVQKLSMDLLLSNDFSIPQSVPKFLEQGIPRRSILRHQPSLPEISSIFCRFSLPPIHGEEFGKGLCSVGLHVPYFPSYSTATFYNCMETSSLTRISVNEIHGFSYQVNLNIGLSKLWVPCPYVLCRF